MFTQTLLEELTDQIEDFGVESDLRTDYSGRGMYGATCVGWTVENVPAFAARLAIALMEVLDTEYEVFQIIDSMATDSMGLDTIAYFPGLAVSE